MDLSELLEDSNKDLVIIYPGRFHPFHIGHGKVYQYLKINYPNAQVFISTSDNTDGDRSPFTFEEKKKMMILAGVDSGAIVQCKSPYQSVEITERFDENKTVVVFAVSEKDMEEEPRFDFSKGISFKKNGEPAYLQQWRGLDSSETFSKHGYLATTPTYGFKVRGVEINSASQIRNMIATSDDTELNQILQDLYNITDVPQDIIEIFKRKIGNKETMNENWSECSLSEFLIEIEHEEKKMKKGILKTITEGKVLDVVLKPITEGKKDLHEVVLDVDYSRNPDALVKAINTMGKRLNLTLMNAPSGVEDLKTKGEARLQGGVKDITAFVEYLYKKGIMPYYNIVKEGKSPHKKGTKKYNAHMAAIHAESNESEFTRKVQEITEKKISIFESLAADIKDYVDDHKKHFDAYPQDVEIEDKIYDWDEYWAILDKVYPDDYGNQYAQEGVMGTIGQGIDDLAVGAGKLAWKGAKKAAPHVKAGAKKGASAVGKGLKKLSKIGSKNVSSKFDGTGHVSSTFRYNEDSSDSVFSIRKFKNAKDPSKDGLEITKTGGMGGTVIIKNQRELKDLLVALKSNVDNLKENYANEQHEQLEYIHHVLQECGAGNVDNAMVDQAIEFVEDIREQHFNADGSTKSESIKEGLDNDDTRNIAIRCVDEMVSQGLIPNDMDTDNQTEFEIQDIIHDHINKALQVRESQGYTDTGNIAGYLDTIDEYVEMLFKSSKDKKETEIAYRIQNAVDDIRTRELGLKPSLIRAKYNKEIKEEIDYDNLNSDDIHGTNIKDYPEYFDVKEVDDDLNVCDRCGDIQRWYDEMYWKGEEDMETNEILGDDNEAVCDRCFGELAREHKANESYEPKMGWEKPSGDVPKDHEYGPGSEDRPKGKRGYTSSRNARTSHLKSIKKWANKKRRQMDKDAKDGVTDMGKMTSDERAKRSWAMIASKDYDNKSIIKDGVNQDQSPESIEQMQEIYKYNEDRNHHSGNILMLAHAFGTRPEIKAIEGLMKIIKRQGHVTPEQNDLMYNAIHKKYYQELFPQAQEGNEFSGELAKAKIDGKKSFKVDGKTYKVKEALTKLIDNQKFVEAGIINYSDAKGKPKYKEGQKAAKNGEPYDSNPYDGAEKLHWSKGHNDWRQENRRKQGKPNYGARGQFEDIESDIYAQDTWKNDWRKAEEKINKYFDGNEKYLEEIMDHVTSDSYKDETGDDYFWNKHSDIITDNFYGDWDWTEAIQHWDDKDIVKAKSIYQNDFQQNQNVKPGNSSFDDRRRDSEIMPVVRRTSESEDEDGVSAEDLVDIITHRIKMNKELMLSLLGDEGPGPLMRAIEDVAEFHSGTTEVGSSDVSIMVKEVIKSMFPLDYRKFDSEPYGKES